MNSDGHNILELFKKIREICEQVALLLRSQEAQMEKKKWSARNTTAISEMSWNIKYPSWWIPFVAFRFYQNKDYPSKLAFTSVLFDDHKSDEYSLEEPIITAGFFDYKEKGVEENPDYSFARIFGILSKEHNLESKGEPFSFDRTVLPPNYKGNFESGKVFALPLVSIENDKDVKSKITNKLLKLVENKE